MPEIGRNKYWNELTADEKIERMRQEVKRLQGSNSYLRSKIDKMEKHYHKTDGKLAIDYDHDRYGNCQEKAISIEGKEYF